MGPEATSTPQDPPRGLADTIARLVPATLFVQVVSFGSSIVMATRLGATSGTDAYYLALSVPAVVYGVLMAAVKLGGIPVLAAASHSEKPDGFVTGCSELVTAVLAGTTALGAAATTVLIFVLPAAAGGSAHLQTLTRTYMLELAPYAVSGAVIGVLGAILAVRGKFIAPSLALAVEPALKSCLVLLFHRQLGAQALVIGSLAGNLAAVAILWKLVRRSAIPLRLVAFRSSELVRSLVKVSAPLIISQSVLLLNPFIDRVTSAEVGPGSVTMFEVGVRLFSASSTLLTAAIIAPLAAAWSHRLAVEGWGAVVRSFGRVVTVVVTVVPPIVVVGFLLRDRMVNLAYRSHAYAPAAVAHTADVFGILLFSLLPQVLIVATATLFVVRKETIFPMKVGIANCVLNATLDVILRGALGIAGIALSTTVTLTLLCVVYLREAHRRWGPLKLQGPGRVAIVSFASAAAIAVTDAFLLTLFPMASSRVAAISSIGAVLLVAGAIHSLFIGVNGLTQHVWPLTGSTRVSAAAAAILGAISPRPSSRPVDRNQS